jgi:hypothetical protein
MAVMPALLLHGETLNRSEGTTRQKGVQYGIVPRLAGGMKFCHRQVQKLNYQFKRRQWRWGMVELRCRFFTVYLTRFDERLFSYCMATIPS